MNVLFNIASLFIIFISIFSINDALIVTNKIPKTIAVAGASGRLGRQVVEQLLVATNSTCKIKACVRDIKKGKEILSDLPSKVGVPSSRLEIIQSNFRKDSDIEELCKDIDTMIWCATGFTDQSSIVNKLVGLLRLKFAPQSTIDIEAVATIGEILKAKGSLPKKTPRIIMCSSAGVTRPSWSEEKKERYIGASDIPIVRLNPFNILDVKAEGEEALRQTGVDYCILRPTGLADQWPNGRPILSQGDVAVGRICRQDVAKLLVSLVDEPNSNGKTIEALAAPSLPYPRSFDDQLQRLVNDKDCKNGLPQALLDANYALLQQLLPGETLKANELAAGQKYEEFDNDKEGFLGKRGEEDMPIATS